MIKPAVLRVLQIIFTYLLCCLIAGFGVAALMALIEPFEPGGFFSQLPLGVLAAILVALLLALPISLVVMGLEHWRVRRLVIYVVVGVLAGAILGAAMSLQSWFPVAGAGLGAFVGWVYWVLAGRHAGALKDVGDGSSHKILLVLLFASGISVFGLHVISALL